jgi:hypothetical protein
MSDKHFEMAQGDSPAAIAEAVQRSIMHSLRDIVGHLKRETPDQPGLTWMQIEFLLSEFEKKKPEIIVQEHEV